VSKQKDGKQVKVGWCARDRRVAEAPYIALAQIGIKPTTKMVLHRGNHATLKYAEDGLSCRVLLPGLKATVMLTAKGRIFFNVSTVTAIEYEKGFGQETEWVKHPDPVPFFMEETETDRALYIDTALSHTCQHRDFFVNKALTQTLGYETAETMLYHLPKYPQVSRESGQVVLTWRDLEMNIRKIEAHYDRNRGWVYFHVRTDYDANWKLELDTAGVYIKTKLDS